MFKRQSLLAACSRPVYTPARVNGIRYVSEVQPGSRQRGQEKGSKTMPSNPPPGETPTPHSAPNTGRTRQQRAAQVSEEVRMLNRGSPSAKVKGNNSPYPAVRSRDVDPEAVGGASPRERRGQMGRNVSAEREGPHAQGVGRPIRAGKASQQSRSERSVAGALEDPAEGGARLLAQEAASQEEVEDEDEGPVAPSTQHELILLEQFDKQDITAVPFEPESVTKNDYLKLGQGGATIAAGNYEGVVEDRLRLLAEPTQDNFRWAPDIALRMLKGGFVSFNDEKEKAAVIAAAEKHAHLRTDAFEPVPKKGQDALFDKLVRGAYTDPSLAPHKQSILNHVVRNTLRNSTYLERDQSKLLKKIRSLLPSEAAAARKPAPKAAKK